MQACLVYGQDLASERQESLEASVSALLSGTARAVALDEIDLAFSRVTLGAVGKLAGESGGFEHALAAREFAGVPRRVALFFGVD